MTLELNEITILMALNSVGIIALMGMFLHLSLTGIFGKQDDSLSEAHYARN
jgi:hypothetical protein